MFVSQILWNISELKWWNIKYCQCLIALRTGVTVLSDTMTPVLLVVALLSVQHGAHSQLVSPGRCPDVTVKQHFDVQQVNLLPTYTGFWFPWKIIELNLYWQFTNNGKEPAFKLVVTRSGLLQLRYLCYIIKTTK